MLQPPDYIKNIATDLSLKPSQIQTALRLFEEGNTIPFIARYRKEMTGELDETQLREISAQYDSQKALYSRKEDVIRLLTEQGVFEDEELAQRIFAAVQAAKTLTEVEDIYRPYRPKRKTRASVAKEKGLGPLYDWLTKKENYEVPETEVLAHANRYVSEDLGVLTPLEALQGACDIFAEEVADSAETRKWVRQFTFRSGSIRSVATNPDTESVYEVYYSYEEPLSKTVPHRILAMNRGEREDLLRVSITVPQEEIVHVLANRHVTSRMAKGGYAHPTYVGRLLENTVADAYKRLLAPAIEREIRAELTASSEEHAIGVFGENLHNLLMQPPIRNKNVLGVDPAYRTGCKLAVVDDTGKLQRTSVIYPTPPQNKVEQAREHILEILSEFQIGLIAIGNGTASRETEAFIAECVQIYRVQSGITVPYMIVSEAGASVYSASVLAREEFPELDVAMRSAISIARRVQDPLAELVKIDPKSVGVGQYQHDVSQKRLDDKLGDVVESAVNRVGVDVNTASPSLLSYVSGLNKTVAKNIVDYRIQNGRFKNRKMLAKVPRLGPKTLEQCVGFLRIMDGEEVLDATPIHPEAYPAVEKLLTGRGEARAVLTIPEVRSHWIADLRATSISTLSSEVGIGVPTLRDILDALERPGRDPREDVPAPILRTDVLKIEDLEEGMVLAGTIRNVVDFGAFVDIGIKNDGLVHVSQLSDRFVKNPLDVVSVGQVVQVRVLQVDVNKGRVSLSMKGLSS